MVDVVRQLRDRHRPATRLALLSNASAGPAFDRWVDAITRLQPIQVQMYSTDRPVPEAGVEWVPPERLQQLATRAADQTGLDVRAYWPARRWVNGAASCAAQIGFKYRRRP